MKSKNKLIEFASAGLPRATAKISDGRDVTMRAFAVKELKLLMMADASGSAQDEQVLQVLNQCIETEGVDAKYLPSHDIEVLFVELYKISKGTSLVPVKFRCTHENEDGESCNTPINVNANLNNISVEGNKETTVALANGLVLNMRHPNVLEREYFGAENEEAFNLAMRCIYSIDTGTEVMVVGQDVSYEEVAEVIEYLDEKSFGSLVDFVGNIPTIVMHIPLKCPHCGHKEVVTLRGLADFFD